MSVSAAVLLRVRLLVQCRLAQHLAGPTEHWAASLGKIQDAAAATTWGLGVFPFVLHPEHLSLFDHELTPCSPALAPSAFCHYMPHPTPTLTDRTRHWRQPSPPPTPSPLLHFPTGTCHQCMQYTRTPAVDGCESRAFAGWPTNWPKLALRQVSRCRWPANPSSGAADRPPD